MGDEGHSVARPKLAAGALFLDDHERVLLVRPSYKPHWDIPGGYVEPGESPREACAREVHEELHLRRSIGRLLVVDWAPHPDEGDKLLFLFDGGTLAAGERDRIRLDPGELLEYAFHEEAAIRDVVPPRLARRIDGALSARHFERSTYLEHGRAPRDRVQAVERGSAEAS